MAPSSPPRRAPGHAPRAPASPTPRARRALPAPAGGGYSAALAKAAGQGRACTASCAVAEERGRAVKAGGAAARQNGAPHAHGAAADALRRLAAGLAANRVTMAPKALAVPHPRTPEVTYDVAPPQHAAPPPSHARPAVPTLNLTPLPRSGHRPSDDAAPCWHTAHRAAARRSSSASGAPTPRVVLGGPLPATTTTAWRPPYSTPQRKEPESVVPRRRLPAALPSRALPRAAPRLLAAARTAVDDAVITVAAPVDHDPVTPYWAGVRSADGSLATGEEMEGRRQRRWRRWWGWGRKR